MINIYTRKQRWKAVLFITALVIIGLSMAYSNILVDNIAEEEERKVRLWANTVQEKAELVKFANDLFSKMKKEEAKKSEIWAQEVMHLLFIATGLLYYCNRIVVSAAFLAATK